MREGEWEEMKSQRKVGDIDVGFGAIVTLTLSEMGRDCRVSVLSRGVARSEAGP